MKSTKQQSGFTVIEILVVMGLIAILSTVVLVALNPGKHFAQARDTQRTANVAAILNAIGQNMAEYQGVFSCPGSIPELETKMSSKQGDYNIAACLSPTYLPTMPYDPKASDAHYSTDTEYDTGYTIVKDPITKRITINAPATESGSRISVTR